MAEDRFRTRAVELTGLVRALVTTFDIYVLPAMPESHQRDMAEKTYNGMKALLARYESEDLAIAKAMDDQLRRELARAIGFSAIAGVTPSAFDARAAE